MQTKKSAVDFTDLAIGILILGVIATIGATILTTFRDTKLTGLSTVTTSNETIVGSNTTGTQVANSWVKSWVYVQNSTSGTAVPATNYTTVIDGATGSGKLTLAAGVNNYIGQNLNVTYSWYNTSRADWTLADDAATGIAEYGNWFKIIVIVGVAALVLSIIFLSFGRRGNEGIGGSY